MFVDIKHRLHEPEILRVIAYSQYECSLERAAKRARECRENPAMRFFGWVEGDAVLGVCGFLVQEDKLEITSIAVEETARGLGIGRSMVAALRKRYPALPIEAETDDDAIGFYRKCGFQTNAIEKHGVRRWACALEETL